MVQHYEEVWLELEKYDVIRDTDKAFPENEFKDKLRFRDKYNKLSENLLSWLVRTDKYAVRARKESQEQFTERNIRLRKEQTIAEISLFQPEKAEQFKADIDKLSQAYLSRYLGGERGRAKRKATVALRNF